MPFPPYLLVRNVI